MELKAYSRAPNSYSSKGTPLGSNSEIYRDVISELTADLEDIDSIHLSMYLFNNAELYRKLLQIANGGAEVTVTSLPLTGYDQRKIEMARHLYNKIWKDGKIDLKIFPHMYVWFGARYSGGGASYSFHLKAGLIKYSNETCKAFMSSGNLAPGDPTHSETAIFLKGSYISTPIQMFSLFFSESEKRAKPFPEYNRATEGLSPELQRVFDFSFVGGINMKSFNRLQTADVFFTAPFLEIDNKGSNHYARERLVEIISSAKQRLLVCAQHSHDLSPFNGYAGQTMINSIIAMRDSSPSADVRVLKQVASSGLADKRRAAFVESHLFHTRIPQKANKLVHDKFVVADDAVVITTGNFTATQFGWGRKQMEQKTGISDFNAAQNVLDSSRNFFETPGGYVRAVMTRPRKRTRSPEVKILKKDIFSEVNAFVVLENPELADKMSEYFEMLWRHNLSADVEVPL